MRFIVNAVLLVAVTVALPNPAGALIITQLEPSSAYAAASCQISDRGNYIEVDLTKEFFNPGMINSPLVLQFSFQAGDAGKEVWLVHRITGPDVGETVTNSTGVTWTDFHFLAVNLPPFLPQYANAAFTNLAGVSSDAFGPPTFAAGDRLDFAGGPVLPGGLVHFTGIRITHNDKDGTLFYLKEIPTPEPASLALLAAGAAVLAVRRKR